MDCHLCRPVVGNFSMVRSGRGCGHTFGVCTGVGVARTSKKDMAS